MWVIPSYFHAALLGNSVQKHRRFEASSLPLSGYLASPALLELTFVNNMFIFRDMITSFANKETEKLFATGKSKKLPPEIITRSIIRLTQLDSAREVTDLILPPSNRLETLSGDRAGQWCIRINDQWRICFQFADGEATHVEITDYH
jgi:proteic killer suppression protein